MSESALRDLEAYFSQRNRPMPEENRKQAYEIEGGELLANPNGTAPGQYVEAEGVHYFLLPGPPLEMRPMFANHVLPRLRKIFSQRDILVSRIVHFCGIGESDVDEQIRHLTAAENPTVAPYAGEGEMVVRITATGPDEETARQRIAPVEAELLSRFGRYIYGFDDDSLASVVAKRLSECGETLAVAESCTGGLLAAMLTELPGASVYFLGGIVAYSNAVKEAALGVRDSVIASHGAVSEETARAMAEGVRSRLGATYGIGITGIAGPGGGTETKPVGLVYAAIASPTESQVFRLQYRGSREQIRLRAAKHALWRLWGMLPQTRS